MAREKPIQTFPDPVVFEIDRIAYRLIHLDPNSMEVLLVRIEDSTNRKLPFAHLPKSVKKKIRPL